MKLYCHVPIIVFLFILSLTACEETYKESNVTFTCQFYDVDIHSDTLIIEIYDKDNNFIDKAETDINGQATITLPTDKDYYVNAYGYDTYMHYVKGSTNFYLDNNNPYESVLIPFKYAKDPNK